MTEMLLDSFSYALFVCPDANGMSVSYMCIFNIIVLRLDEKSTGLFQNKLINTL